MKNKYFYILLVAGVIILFGFIGTPGLWDNFETNQAEIARIIAKDGNWLLPRIKLGTPRGGDATTYVPQPLLPVWITAVSFKILGNTEFAAKIPGAILVLLLILMIYWIVARIFSERTGFISGLICLSLPLLLFECRILNFDLYYIVFFNAALLAYALLRFTEIKKSDFQWIAYLFWACLGLTYLSKGIIPLLVIVGIIALEGILNPEKIPWRRLNVVPGIILLMVLTIPVTLLILKQPELGGAAWVQFFLYQPIWDKIGNAAAVNHVIQWNKLYAGTHLNFDYLVRNIGYGLFPWICFVPFGLAGLIVKVGDDFAPASDEDPHQALKSFLLLAFVIPFFVSAFTAIRYKVYSFPAIFPIAIATALFIIQREKKRDPNIIAAFIAVILYILLVKYTIKWPERVLEFLIYNKSLKLTLKNLNIAVPLALITGGMVMSLALYFLVPYKERLSKWFLYAGLGFSFLSGVFLGIYFPYKAAFHTSYKSMFESAKTLVKEGKGDIYKFRINQNKTFFYGNDIEELTLNEIEDQFATASSRMNLIFPKEDLIKLTNLIRKKRGRLNVIDNRSSLLFLGSNRISSSEIDLNVINKALLPVEPSPMFPVNVNLENSIMVLGYDIDPHRGTKWGKIKITYYFKCLRPIRQSYKIFVHIDGKGRLSMDHNPVCEIEKPNCKGVFTTNYWQPGDIIKNVQYLSVPPLQSKGVYTMYLGFYLGSRRLKIIEPRRGDRENRIEMGKVVLN